jgi:hypothetical protein
VPDGQHCDKEGETGMQPDSIAHWHTAVVVTKLVDGFLEFTALYERVARRFPSLRNRITKHNDEFSAKFALKSNTRRIMGGAATVCTISDATTTQNLLDSLHFV